MDTLRKSVVLRLPDYGSLADYGIVPPPIYEPDSDVRWISLLFLDGIPCPIADDVSSSLVCDYCWGVGLDSAGSLAVDRSYRCGSFSPGASRLS